MKNRKKIFMCGSTSGFGLCLAEVFSQDFDVILNGRRKNLDFPTIVKNMNDITIEDFISFDPDIIVNNGFDKNDYVGSYSGSINVLKRAMEFFMGKKRGIIININSFYGTSPDKKDPDYAAAKYGLRGYTESITEEAYLNNIKIINVYPRAMRIGQNDGREDFQDLIDPVEVSELILNISRAKTFVVGSIQIDRIKNIE